MSRKSILAAFSAGCALFGLFVIGPTYGINTGTGNMVVQGTVEAFITVDTLPFNFTFPFDDFAVDGKMLEGKLHSLTGGLTVTSTIPAAQLQMSIESLNPGLQIDADHIITYDLFVGVAGCTKANATYHYISGTPTDPMTMTTATVGAALTCIFEFHATAAAVTTGVYADTVTFTVARFNPG